MPGLRIEQIPPGVALQDEGRPGYRRFGVTKGGAMDPYALAEGQALLQNKNGSAALEMASAGSRFRSLGCNRVVCTGAEMKLTVNGHRAPWRQTINLANDDCLEFGAFREGAYGYLHLPGGIQGPVLLGSRSTHAQAELGWRPQIGDRLDPVVAEWSEDTVRLPRPAYFSQRTIRIMAGPQTRLFRDNDRRALEEAEFTVTSTRNRVGVRLESTHGPMDAELGTSIVSDAIVAGDIQVAADGIAAILLADCQPVGGYPRIATVISADLHIFAQIPQDMKFRMRLVELDRAVGELSELRREIAVLPAKLEPAFRDPRDISDLMSYSLIDGVVSGED